jgi:hypothetical protein
MAAEAALLGAARSDWFAATRARRILKTIEAVMGDPCFCGGYIATTFVTNAHDALRLPSPRQKIQKTRIKCRGKLELWNLRLASRAGWPPDFRKDG